MPESTCPTCGQPMPAGDCPRCRVATAFAKPEHAKVTPPAADDAAIREGQPPLAPKPVEPWTYKHEPGPGCGYGCLTYVVLGFIALFFVGLLMPTASRVKEASAKSNTINNMKQIALACHCYHDANRRFPNPAMVVTEDGKEREVQLSWRVSILPYVEQQTLLKEFDLTRGWDQEKNAGFQNRMPWVYTCPYREEIAPKRLIHFQYFTGPGTLFPDNGPRNFKEIPDGTDRTFLFAEADQPVVWTGPSDIAIRAREPLPLPADRFLAAMGDGVVRMIDRSKTSDTILRQLINPNDQKPDAGWDN